jgi:hypothetical protein
VATVSARGLYAAMSLVVKPSARERFMPRELVDAYKDFEERGPHNM